MYMCLKLPLEDLKSSPFYPHLTSIYTSRVTIAPKVHSNKKF